jgi:hypothetical protein
MRLAFGYKIKPATKTPALLGIQSVSDRHRKVEILLKF